MSKMWQYNIEWYKDPSFIERIVTVRSKPRHPDNNLQIISWTNYDASSISISRAYAPLTIYTQGTTSISPILTILIIITNTYCLDFDQDHYHH